MKQLKIWSMIIIMVLPFLFACSSNNKKAEELNMTEDPKPKSLEEIADSNLQKAIEELVPRSHGARHAVTDCIKRQSHHANTTFCWSSRSQRSLTFRSHSCLISNECLKRASITRCQARCYVPVITNSENNGDSLTQL